MPNFAPEFQNEPAILGLNLFNSGYNMPKNLVIVESPAKAKTIEKYLGKDYKVMASQGHIRDLHKSDFSIDVEHGFRPIYEIPEDKKRWDIIILSPASASFDLYPNFEVRGREFKKIVNALK